MGKFILNGISYLIIPLGIISFALQVYFETKNILHLVFFLIGFLFYVLLLSIIYRLRHAIRERENTIKKQEKITQDLWKSQEEIFKSLSTVIKSDVILSDEKHHYSLIETNYKKEGHDGYACMHLVGVNISGAISDYLRIRIGGDSPIDDLKKIDLHAIDKYSNEEIHAEIIKELETLYFKPHKVYFKNPLPHSSPFDIEIKYKWPGAFTRQSDYFFYILHANKKGVNHFKTKIELDFKPGLIRLYEINTDGMAFNLTPLAIPIDKEKNIISFEIPYPTKSLLLQWVP